MKIAIIGPGIMPIPTDGWGAVEEIVWQYTVNLRNAGHSVDIFNEPDLGKICREINSGNYDFVHCQYDNHVGFLNRNLKVPFVATSHYGYICRKQYWDGGYYDIHREMLKCPGIIALSDEIAEVYRKDGYGGPIQVLRNGADVKKFTLYAEGLNDSICLGKIEPRKQQAKLQKMLDGYMAIDFVGPVVDSSFNTNGKTCRYLGTWTRVELQRLLSSYRVLILPSLGEAAALVIPEAQAAGCNIVCTEVATANLDESTPGIRVVQDNFGPEIFTAIKESLMENAKIREKIRNYSETKWDWSRITREYLKEIIPFFQKTLEKI